MLSKLTRIRNNAFGYIKSLFWKRDRKSVVFGAWFGTKFADNSRYLFQYLNDNKVKYNLEHVVWITRNDRVRNELIESGYESYLAGSRKSIKFLKHSKYHFICNNSDDNGYETDIPCEYSYGAVKINLWHGVGVVKGVGAMSKSKREYRLRHPVKSLITRCLTDSKAYRALVSGIGGWKNCYYLVPSELGHRQLGEMFHLKDSQFIITGQPRCCPCPKLMQQEERVIKKFSSYSQVILYLPTFRTNTSSKNYTNISGFLKTYLEAENILWIEKAHDADKSKFNHIESNNIITLNSDFDINTIIPNITMLITDYSSVISDGRAWNKPVLLYLPDYDEYFEGDNGLIEDSELLMSGPKFTTPADLLAGIKKTFKDPSYAFTEGFDQMCFSDLREMVTGIDKGFDEIWNDIIKNVEKGKKK